MLFFFVWRKLASRFTVLSVGQSEDTLALKISVMNKTETLLNGMYVCVEAQAVTLER